MVELKTQKLAAPRDGGSLRLFLPPSVLSTLTAAEISFKSPPARSNTSCQSGFGKDAGFCRSTKPLEHATLHHAPSSTLTSA